MFHERPFNTVPVIFDMVDTISTLLLNVAQRVLKRHSSNIFYSQWIQHKTPSSIHLANGTCHRTTICWLASPLRACVFEGGDNRVSFFVQQAHSNVWSDGSFPVPTCDSPVEFFGKLHKITSINRILYTSPDKLGIGYNMARVDSCWNGDM